MSLNGIVGEHLVGAGEVDEGADLFIAIFFRFMLETFLSFSADGRADRAAAAAPDARAFSTGPAGLPPCTTTLPCRLRAGALGPWAMPEATWPATRSAGGDCACATSTGMGDCREASMTARYGGEDGPELAVAGQRQPGRGGSRNSRAEISLAPNLLRIGGELGSASHPVNLWVEGELLPRPVNIFTGWTHLRGLLGQIFPRRPVYRR